MSDNFVLLYDMYHVCLPCEIIYDESALWKLSRFYLVKQLKGILFSNGNRINI